MEVEVCDSLNVVVSYQSPNFCLPIISVARAASNWKSAQMNAQTRTRRTDLVRANKTTATRLDDVERSGMAVKKKLSERAWRNRAGAVGLSEAEPMGKRVDYVRHVTRLVACAGTIASNLLKLVPLLTKPPSSPFLRLFPLFDACCCLL
jgi:hypothetical protein